MAVEYYIFLEEIRMISNNVENLQKSLNKKTLNSLMFMENLTSHIERIDNLLKRC